MTVASNEYDPVSVQSSNVSVVIPISWPYGNASGNLIVIQQDLTTGDTRSSIEGGFVIVKNAAGDELTVEQYSAFVGNLTEYTVFRNMPVSQDYDLTEQANLSSSSLEQALDDTVRQIADIKNGNFTNAITSVNPYAVADSVSRAGKVSGFDSNGDPVNVGDINDVADISAAVDSAEASATAASASASAAAVSEANANQSAIDAAASAALIPLNNNLATTDPGVTDDSDSGYSVNSLWGNTTSDSNFICADATVGAAVWNPIDNDATPAPTMQTFTSSGTYTPPAGLRSIKVTCTGGGGGGGGTTSARTGGDGGGAGGTAIKYILASALGATETITVGAGGAGGVGGGASGSGNTSSFGSHCSATGGTGGASDQTEGGAGGVGGVGSSGDIDLIGGYGGSGIRLDVGGMGGSGGASFWGGGAGMSASVTSWQNGQGGQAYGSGGAGGCSNSTTDSNGGAGKVGIITVEEYY